MPQSLSCPNCNAPLSYDGYSFTIECDYCHTTVIVPAEMRGEVVEPASGLPSVEAQAVWAEVKNLSYSGQRIEAIARLHEAFDVDLGTAKEAVDRLAQGQELSTSQFALRSASRPQVMDVHTSEHIRSLLEAGEKIEAIRVYRQVMDVSLKEAKEAVEAMQIGFQALEEYPAWQPATDRQISTRKRAAVGLGTVGVGTSCLGGWMAIAILLVTTIPILIALTATGGPLYEPWMRINPFAELRLLLSFGGEGTGPGLFQDARYVATDNSGHIFVGEYDTGRIHIFDMGGKFLGQWTAVNEKDYDYYLRGMTVDRQGEMFLAAQGEVYAYEALTGELFGKLQPPDTDAYFDEVTLGQDGLLYVVDTRDGDHILRYDRNGEVILNLQNAVSSVSGESESTLRLAADGLGTIFALSLSTEHIYAFAPDGRFITRFGGEGEEEGQFTSSYSIAVDNQSRVYASDHGGLLVFAGDGRYLDKLSMPAYVYGLCFNDQNWLFTISNDNKVRVWEVK
jgi:ribosomal protein L7/L12/outer membrane protein assembly factor BamB